MNQVLEKYKLIKEKDCGCEEIYTLDVCIDENPENPRNDGNIGIMVCFNREYTIGDKHKLKSKDFSSINDVREYLIDFEKPIVILPLYLLNHSGLSIAIDNRHFKACDSNGWDWGQVGYIYTTHEQLKKYHQENLTSDEIENILNTEVKLYDQYLKGDYYGFILYKNGEPEDSCWGFDDKNDMIEEIQRDVKQRHVKGEWKQIK